MLRVVITAACVVGVTCCYLMSVRPRLARWGATDEEVSKPLPGDDLDPGSRVISTRAITINASREEVWPWLVQIGHDRGGFYSHDWVERLMGLTYAEGRSAIRIHPEFQQVGIGDPIPFHSLVSIPITSMERPHYLTIGAGWAFVLEQAGERSTRMIIRTRGGWFEPMARKVPVLWPLAVFIDAVPGEIPHHYMEAGMLLGIKQRAETLAQGTGVEHDSL